MRTFAQSVALLSGTLLLFVSCPSGPRAAQPESGPPRFISAADPRFRYEGRFDLSDRAHPVVIWQASRIRIDFESATLALLFRDMRGQCFFNAQIDGANTVVAVREGTPSRIELPVPGAGRHRLLLVKRSEATAGRVSFAGLELAPGAGAWAPPPSGAKLKMEFIGDSITAGACNEDGARDQWEDRGTHNGTLSYAALTAAAFAADERIIAVSGMGVAVGWAPMTAGSVWDRTFPDPSSPRADLAAWTPDVVLVNLGENDDSFSRAHGRAFPPGYADGYVALVRAIRQSHPAARIVLLRGGMDGGARSEPLRRAWETAVQRLETDDANVSHFVFAHWTQQHPRVADDRVLADELVRWLGQQAFMRKYR